MIDVSCTDIIKDGDKYIIKWFALEYSGYKPTRSGYNEDFGRKGAKAQGKRVLCETAFVLDKGESGKTQFNYRCVSSHGQHYEQYGIYFINTDKLEYNSFQTAKYKYGYSQMADLF